MPDTDSYNIFYKEKGAASYQKIEGVQSSEYTITELKDKTTYEVYLTGVNELGGKRSIHSFGGADYHTDAGTDAGL